MKLKKERHDARNGACSASSGHDFPTIIDRLPSLNPLKLMHSLHPVNMDLVEGDPLRLASTSFCETCSVHGSDAKRPQSETREGLSHNSIHKSLLVPPASRAVFRQREVATSQYGDKRQGFAIADLLN